MAFTLAITGSIGSGKTTLARRLAQAYGALLLSSDEIRASLSHRQRRQGERVFMAMRERFVLALAAQKSVVLDSTGMSPRFRALLGAHRSQLRHIHLHLKHVERFEERERRRTDRPAGPLPRTAFYDSSRTRFLDEPDFVLETDDLTPEEVYVAVVRAGLF